MSRLASMKQYGQRSFRLGVAVLFHPIDAFEELQKHRNVAAAFILIFLTLCVRVITIYMTSFHITGLQPEDANLNLELARFIFPLISGVIACYLITAIMDGEAHFRDVFAGMSYSLIPYIVFTIPMALLSLIISRGEIGLYHSLNIIIWLWVAMLIFIQLKVHNDYTFKKSVGVTLLCLFAFVIFWGTVGLVFALTNHVLQFIDEVAIEIRYLLDN